MDSATAGVALICVGTYMLCRAVRVPAAIPVLVMIVVLLQAGAVGTSSVPGVAQVADVKHKLDEWTEERTEAASRHHRQLAAHTQALTAYDTQLSP